MAKRKTHYEECDILVVGGGMAGTGATFESRYWGRDMKIICAEKANIDRSGAVAQGLYAINCYMGMQWDENQPEDFVRYARNDLMGMVREDLAYDAARHVDSAVHMFEEWGLPLMRNEKTGRYQREGKWQIMIHGESYKPIVAEAAKKSADKIYNRVMITHLLMDETQENRIGGAVGFNMRTGDFHVFRAKAVICCAGGASHLFKPRSVGEGMGRTWYAPWSNGSAYALPIAVGAKMTQMENRIVLTRFKDGYGPVGAYFLHLKTYTQNANGENYEEKWYDNTKEIVGEYIDHVPRPTCLRNHAFIQETAAGGGPIHMVTMEAFQDPHLEQIGWENFLGMTVGQAVVWASQDIDPKYQNPELTTSEPYVMGSHATCSGAWVSGPEDLSPPEYFWGYNRMMTIEGLFGAGDAAGGTPHIFSSGSFTEGRICAKSAVQYINDGRAQNIKVTEEQIDNFKTEVFKPLENYQVGRNEITAGTVSPSYLLPIQALQRLQKIMDDYVGGIGTNYMTNANTLKKGLKDLGILQEDLEHIGAEDYHQLMRAWEVKHRALVSQCVTEHTLFREETRWPGYYYRGDFLKLDDDNWHCLTVSRRDPKTGKFTLEKAPIYHLIEDEDKGETEAS